MGNILAPFSISGDPLNSSPDSGEALAALMQCTGDAIFLLDGSTANLLCGNEAFCSLLGYKQADIAHLSLLDLVDDDAVSVRQNLQNVLSNGSIHFVHRVYRRRDQSRVDVEVTATVVPSADGDLVGVVARDITGRKIAEREQHRLREAVTNAAAEWRHTFDAIPSPIFLLDRDMRIHRLNRAGAELLERSIHDSLQSVLPSDSFWNAVTVAVREAFTNASALCAPVSEESRQWQLNITPSGNERAVVVLNDITALHTLQESLRKSEIMSAMGALVAGVAHEVRNPIFTISALLETYELSFRFTDEQRPYIQHLRVELERLNRLMQDLLVYGKAGTTTRSHCDLVQLVNIAMDLNSGLAKKRAVTMTFDTPPRVETSGDSTALTEAFRNVIENALHHTSAAGSIDVGLKQECGDAVFCVRDRGDGFSEEALQHAVEPFFSRRCGGTGLGLAIAQRVALEHGGKIKLENHPQSGAVVHISLPIEACR